MTIKQQGGIFGRNPTFNNVDVEGTLTVNGEPISDFGTMAQQDADSVNIDGGAIDGITLGTNSAVTDARIDNIQIDGNTISSTDTNGNINLTPNGSGIVSVEDYLTQNTATSYGLHTINQGGGVGATMLALNQTAADNYLIDFLFYGTSKGGIYQDSGNNIQYRSVAQTKFVVNSQERASIDTNGNLTLSTGNLVIGTSGKGIDFSATSGTGTSELFDDYEEGNWTPTYTTDGTDFDSVSYDSRTHGRYVKIGSLVYVSCVVYTDGITVGSASGDVLIGGLPFTVSNDPSNAEGYTGAVSSTSFTGDHPSVGFAMRNSTTIKLQYRATANGAVSDLQIADLNTGANDNFLQLALSYRV
jgi:hypothetical protein